MKLVLDIETQNSFQDVGSRSDLSLLKVSVVVAYFYPEDKFYTFTESEMDQLENLILQSEYIIGFNTIGFDLPVLQQYMKTNLLNKKQIDLMVELENVLGYKVGLQAVAKGTLGIGKLSSGMEAIKMWQEGRLEELKKYCLEDVRLTKEIYEHGLKNGAVKFNAGWENYEVPVAWC
ncbi:MAG: ribonuclease H-like domain-containing protein [Patescibacteria group bacterium]|nr:ribonuclease H-like domain-containing protein [Patescibacteria group bacterium]